MRVGCRMLALALALGVVIVLTGACSHSPQLTDADAVVSVRGVRAQPGTYAPLPPLSDNAAALQDAIAKASALAIPTVVTLRVETGAPMGPSYGAGVIIDESGLILTNDHVVDGAKEIHVLLVTVESYTATVVGRDEYTDLALLQIEAKDPLPAMPIGDSADCYIGQIVLAFGNPFGISFKDAQPTVTLGIIGALNRVSTPPGTQRVYRRAIQHDAAINPGNSGGPLVNLRGELIGINGVISSNTGSSSGISFAIPSAAILDVLPALKRGETPRFGWLGIGELTNVVQQPTTGPGRRGVQVGLVLADSPASTAGLVAGDIIVAANEDAIHGKSELINWLSDMNAGEAVKLHVFRPTSPEGGTGQFITLDVTVGERPGSGDE